MLVNEQWLTSIRAFGLNLKLQLFWHDVSISACMTDYTMRDRLTRVKNDKVIAGVCGGIAKYLGWDASIVRLLYVLISIFLAAFPGMLVYAVLWIVMPEEV